MGDVRFLQIKPGQTVMYEKELYRITHLLTGTQVLARKISDDSPKQLSIGKLRQPPPAESLASPRPIAHKDVFAYETDEWKEGQRRFMLIRDLLTDPDRSRKKVEEVAEANNVVAATIYKWMKDFLDNGHVGALIPSPRGRKPGTKKLNENVETIISGVILEKYMKKKIPDRIGEIIAEVIKQCETAKLKPPHPNTIRHRVKAIPIKERLKAAGLLQEYLDKRGPSKGKIKVHHPLQLVQIDHMLVEIVLVDDVCRLPFKRPWVTLAIDVFSRMLVGIYVTFEHPSALSAGRCISMGMCPKEEYLAELGVNGEWPVWGRIGSLHADNAKEFRGAVLKKTCRHYGISTKYRPVKRPKYGAHVERLGGTLKEMILDLPGAIREKKVTSDPVLTLKEFETILLEMVVNVYHHRPHSGIGEKTPLAMWNHGIMGDDQRPGLGIPAVPGNPEKIRIDFLPFKMRTISPDGILIDGIHYQSEAIYDLVGEKDKKTNKSIKYIIRFEHEDLSRVYFYDPRIDDYQIIPYADVTRPPINIWEHREAQKILKKLRQKVDEDALFRTIELNRQRVDAAKTKTKEVRQALQRRKATGEVRKKHSVKFDGKGPIGKAAPKPGKPTKASKGDAFDTSGLDFLKNGPILPFDGLEESK